MTFETFYWYDLETTGTDPRWDRIVQFAGIRTDMDLNAVGDEARFYVECPVGGSVASAAVEPAAGGDVVEVAENRNPL